LTELNSQATIQSSVYPYPHRQQTMSYGIIYKATSPDNKVYIGQTKKPLHFRILQHTYMAYKGDRRSAFQIALLDEGKFTWETIDETATNQEELDFNEKRWITYYKSDDPQYGYNGRAGGSGGGIPNADTRKKIGASQIGNKKALGNKHTAEARRKNSEAHKGEKNHNFGKHLSAETIKKMSAAKRGKRLSEETRKKLSISHIGIQAGTKNSNSKITEEIALKIKTDLQAGIKACEIARKYKISANIVYDIKRGRNWAWLKIPSLTIAAARRTLKI